MVLIVRVIPTKIIMSSALDFVGGVTVVVVIVALSKRVIQWLFGAYHYNRSYYPGVILKIIADFFDREYTPNKIKNISWPVYTIREKKHVVWKKINVDEKLNEQNNVVYVNFNSGNSRFFCGRLSDVTVHLRMLWPWSLHSRSQYLTLTYSKRS